MPQRRLPSPSLSDDVGAGGQVAINTEKWGGPRNGYYAGSWSDNFVSLFYSGNYTPATTRVYQTTVTPSGFWPDFLRMEVTVGTPTTPTDLVWTATANFPQYSFPDFVGSFDMSAQTSASITGFDFDLRLTDTLDVGTAGNINPGFYAVMPDYGMPLEFSLRMATTGGGVPSAQFSTVHIGLSTPYYTAFSEF